MGEVDSLSYYFDGPSERGQNEVFSLGGCFTFSRCSRFATWVAAPMHKRSAIHSKVPIQILSVMLSTAYHRTARLAHRPREAHNVTCLSERNTIKAPTAAPARPAPRAQNSRNFTVLSVSCSPNKKMATRHARNAAAQAPPKMQATHFAIRMTGFIVWLI